MAIVETLLETSFEVGHPIPGVQAPPNRVLYPNSGDTISQILVGSKVAPEARWGDRLVAYLVLPGDPPPIAGTNVQRAEHHHGDKVPNGSIAWYGFSIYVPSNFNQGASESSGYRIIHQFHENEGSPPYSLHWNTKNRGTLYLARKINGKAEAQKIDLDSISNLTNKWLDFVVQVKWSKGNDGFIRYWWDVGNGRELIYEQVGSKTIDHSNGRNPYSKSGIYGNQGGLIYGDHRHNIWVDDEDDYYNTVVAPNADPPVGGTNNATYNIPANTSGNIIESSNDGSGARFFGTNYVFVNAASTDAARKNVGLRVANPGIPVGSTVSLATASWTVDNTLRDDARMDIYAVKEANPAPFNLTNRRPIPTEVPFSDTFVSWNQSSLGAVPVTTPTFASVLQEALDLRTNDSDAIAIVLQGHETDTDSDISLSNNTVSIYVEYEYPGQPAGDPPELETATVVGKTLTLEYSDTLDGASLPDPEDFTVSVEGNTGTVNSVSIEDSSCTLALESAVLHGDTVTVSYVPGTSPLRSVTEVPADPLEEVEVENLTAPLEQLESAVSINRARIPNTPSIPSRTL